LQVDTLIRELIATGTMNDETLADLQRLLADFGAGKLDPDDEVYLRALHARLTNVPPTEPEVDDSQLDGLDLAGWRERALAAEAELAALKASAASTEAASEEG
jgi:hypothetical protein